MSRVILLFLCLTTLNVLAQKNYEEEGKASYYADKLHGHLTSSGEKYDKNKFTAAHKSLPFGTKIKVINLKNNKSVVVTINDRGPYATGRIIDLSSIAAKAVDMIDEGVVPVKITTDLSLSPDEIEEIAAKETAAEQAGTNKTIKNKKTEEADKPAEKKNNKPSGKDTPQPAKNSTGADETSANSSTQTNAESTNKKADSHEESVVKELSHSESSKEIAEEPVTRKKEAPQVAATSSPRNNTSIVGHEGKEISASGETAEHPVGAEISLKEVKAQTPAKENTPTKTTTTVANNEDATHHPVHDIEKSGSMAKVTHEDRAAQTAQPKVTIQIKDTSNHPIGDVFDLEEHHLKPGGYGVQVYSSHQLDHTIAYGKKLSKMGVSPIFVEAALVKGSKYYRLILGNFATRTQAEYGMSEYNTKGVKGFIHQHINHPGH